ncbi:MAG: FAD-dependent oxidoreductase [Candidatus Omnitrophota bacterium]
MKQIVIVGNSAAGVSAAEAIREKDKEAGITIVSVENRLAYYRYLLGDVLIGTVTDKDLLFRQKEFYEELNINLELGKKVEKVNTKRKCVVFEDKSKIEYDYLIIATGSMMKPPKEVKGINKQGVFEFRTVDDLRDISTLIAFSHTVCVWGAGIAGLKAAYGLSLRGLDVKIITQDNRLLSDSLDAQASSVLLKRLQNKGIEFIPESEIVEIFGESDVKAIKLDSGKVIGCGILIVDKFKSPRTRLVQDTDIKQDNGIITDQNMKTSDDNIFAAGDVTRVFTPEGYEIKMPMSWANALEQGRIAGANVIAKLHGKENEMLRFTRTAWDKKTEFSAMPLLFFGKSADSAFAATEELLFLDEENSVYKKVLLVNNKIIGFTGVGNITGSDIFMKLIEKDADISSVKDSLLTEQLNDELVKDLIA